MKVGFTINLGDYENMRIESSEYQYLEDCLEEVWMALKATNVADEPAVKRFLDRDLWKSVREKILRDAERYAEEEQRNEPQHLHVLKEALTEYVEKQE